MAKNFITFDSSMRKYDHYLQKTLLSKNLNSKFWLELFLILFESTIVVKLMCILFTIYQG